MNSPAPPTPPGANRVQTALPEPRGQSSEVLHHQEPKPPMVSNPNPPPQPQPTLPVYQQAPATDSHKIRNYVRRSWIVALTGIAGAMMGAYFYNSTPPVYESRATIEIKRLKKDAAELSEKDRIRLTGLGEIAAIVEKLRMPKLYQAMADGHLFQNRSGLVPARRELKAPWKAEIPATERIAAQKITTSTLAGMMQGWVSVRWRENTPLIDLKARHTDPTVARDTLQILILEYERITDQKVDGNSEDTLEYILQSTGKLKEAILKTQTDLQRYARCIELTSAIETAERNVHELEKRYLSRWPELVEANQLVGILRDEFTRELSQVLRLSPTENKFWQENEGMLESLSADEISNVKLRFVRTRSIVMEKDLESDRLLYDNLLTKMKEGEINKGYVAKHFEVTLDPSTPGGPVEPVKKAMVKKGTMAGVGIGALLVFGMGFLDRRIQSVTQLENRFPVPIVGRLPESRKNQIPGAPLMIVDPESKESEKEPYRGLRTAITLLNPAQQPKIMLITSSLPGEGKSWVASNLAASFAMRGELTLLIDGDLRKPVQAGIFGIPKESPGLTDFVADQATLNEAIYRPVPELEKLFVMPAGQHCTSPSEFLASEKVRKQIQRIKVDRIIIDSAPLLPVADTMSLAEICDTRFLVCQVGKTPMAAVDRSWQLLAMNGGNTPSGLIANKLRRGGRGVTSSSYASGGYSYGYGYGYGNGYGDD